MATRSNVVLRWKGNEQRYYHHWDGYPSNMVPMLELVKNNILVEPTSTWKKVEARFWLTFNLYERMTAAMDHNPARRQEKLDKLEAARERDGQTGAILIEGGRWEALLPMTDRNQLERDGPWDHSYLYNVVISDDGKDRVLSIEGYASVEAALKEEDV